MPKMWKLGNLFHSRGEKENESEEAEHLKQEESQDTSSAAVVPEEMDDVLYLPELKGFLLQVWDRWGRGPIPPRISLTGNRPIEELPLDRQKFERERVRLMVQMEKDAKRRLKEIDDAAKIGIQSLNASCHVYLTKDKMMAWAFFFPPIGPDGTLEPEKLGKVLQESGVTSGVDSNEVVRIVQDRPYFSLIPIALGTPAVEGVSGSVVEHYAREMAMEVKMDEDGNADYRSLNYVRQVEEGDVLCDIMPPQPGTPGLQVDGKVVEPRPVKAARVPKGINTEISEDGLHLIVSKAGHLEFKADAFHVRPLLEIKGDVDYSTGNIDFNGDIHVFGDVRENFVVRATGSIAVDGLVEAATVEAGGDLVITRGVVGDHRALLKCKGCVRVKYLENCVVYAGKCVFADCIMTSQIFSDDSICVTSGRGSVIGGALTATTSISAKMVGAQSGRRTELTLGVLPYVQNELQDIAEDLQSTRWEQKQLEKDLAYLEDTEGLGGSSPKLAKMRMRKSVLAMKEQRLVARQEQLAPLTPDLTKCRLECTEIYPVTTLTVQDAVWVANDIRRYCKVVYNAASGELKEVY